MVGPPDATRVRTLNLGRVRNQACKERCRKFLEQEQKQLESQEEQPAKLVGPLAWLDKYNLESGEPDKTTAQSTEVPLSEPASGAVFEQENMAWRYVCCPSYLDSLYIHNRCVRLMNG